MPVRAEWACVKEVRLSNLYTVTMTVGPSGFTCEWEPDVPDPRSLTKKELHDIEGVEMSL
jgi:hypothetical protein